MNQRRSYRKGVLKVRRFLKHAQNTKAFFYTKPPTLSLNLLCVAGVGFGFLAAGAGKVSEGLAGAARGAIILYSLADVHTRWLHWQSEIGGEVTYTVVACPVRSVVPL